MQASWFPDWRGVYGSEHLPGILCTSRNMFSGYISDTDSDIRDIIIGISDNKQMCLLP